METKMKKIPFDLERAKKGEAFRLGDTDVSDNYFVSITSNGIMAKWFQDDCWNKCTFPLLDALYEGWHHLIPDEPKPERWAVVYKMDVYDSKEDAEYHRNGSTDHLVVKLADDEA